MPLDFGKLQLGPSRNQLIEPRKIFATLNRNPRFKRPSDEQGEVLDQWFAKRATANLTIKMNTGSGKTLVGLLCLQSSLNEKGGPAVYIAPNRYLARQVLFEAADLGIKASDNEHDADFMGGRAILVTSIHKLINGKSVFGVGSVKIPLEAIVIDDAHACLSAVSDQFKVELSADHPLYVALLTLFQESLQQHYPVESVEVFNADPNSLVEVPFWTWKDKQREIITEFQKHRADESLIFSLPLISSVLHLCQCVIGGGKMEIAPRCIPIDAIPSFTSASRRIYMTATLADDSILVTHFQADPADVALPIKPRGAGDIGDRMILAPQEMNTAITTDDIKKFVTTLSKAVNVSVIVPSFRRAEYWRDVADQILSKDNIGEGIEKLKKGLVGITVLINRYDGIDLPGKACEVLVIDGLPEATGLIDRVNSTIIAGSDRARLSLVQRLEQGMGRGVRSSEDHCVVFLIGASLTKVVNLQGTRDKFTPATRAQLDLARELARQFKGKPIGDYGEIVAYCLKRNPEWVQASRSAVVNAAEAPAAHIDPGTGSVRAAFDAGRLRQFADARDHVQKAIGATNDPRVVGFLKQIMAEYVHHFDPAEAQSILKSALGANRRVMKPIEGVGYARLSAPQNQADAATNYMKQFVTPNELLLWFEALIEDISWNPAATKKFEAGIRDLGAILGFGSQRPEQETGRGPDNLWAVGGLEYLVIECKSGAQSEEVSKADCNQLLGSVSWFKEKYDASCTCIPIMFHPSRRFAVQAAPAGEFRMVDDEHLRALKAVLRTVSKSLAANGAYRQREKVAELLGYHDLSGPKFVERYTAPFSKSSA